MILSFKKYICKSQTVERCQFVLAECWTYYLLQRAEGFTHSRRVKHWGKLCSSQLMSHNTKLAQTHSYSREEYILLSL